ncbi:MAG: hypothetical protein ACI9C2_000136 [Gammaproteobacteria bacterium]|jgi:hypothetical protein
MNDLVKGSHRRGKGRGVMPNPYKRVGWPDYEGITEIIRDTTDSGVVDTVPT